jgi:energy-coupling factor transport system substrate-specific component
MDQLQIRKLTMAGLFAALSFACFSYLRIEIPMGLGLTGKIYVGHAFILLSGLLLGAKYGALSGAVGLTLADVLAGYTTSAPPTFMAKFILGWTVAEAASHLFAALLEKEDSYGKGVLLSCLVGSLVNVVTEPLIRFSFKYLILGIPYQVAYVSAINCAVSMGISNVVSTILAVLLAKALHRSVLLREAI